MGGNCGVLRLRSTVLTVVGIVGVVLVAMIGMVPFGQALAVLLVGGPMVALFAS